MTTTWQPYREPLRSTLLRTVTLAVVAGGIVALTSHGRIAWSFASLLLLWFSFGGHWIELWYLNWLRPRISPTRSVQVAARVATWFVAGGVMMFGMLATARAIGRAWPIRTQAWWLGGVVFVGVELVAHLGLSLRGRPNFYDGRG